MAEYAGRLLKVKDAGVAIAGLRTKTATINNEPIDITTDDDSGIRKLLETEAGGTLEVANKAIDISFDGITKSDALIKAAAEADALVKEYVLELPSGATITGDFAFTNLELGGEYQDAMTFSGQLMSTGAWVWADAP